MAMRRTIPEAPYLPVAGLNADNNGLSVRPEECVDSLNLRFFQKEVSTRSGTKRIALNTPSGDPILKFHTFKKPNGSEELFGFTKNNVLKYNSSSQQWDHILGPSLEDCETSTGWTLGTGQTIPPASIGASAFAYHGTYSLGFKLADCGAYLDLIQKTGLTWNLTTAVSISFYFYSLAPARNVTLQLYDGVTLKESHDIVWPTGGWTRITVVLTDPTLLTSITKIVFVDNDADTLSAAQFRYLDYFTANNTTLANVEFWHTTDFIDNSVGSSVIACGSNPPKANDPEDDTASRVMLYYDQANSVWKTLTQYKELAKVDELETGKLGPSIASVITCTDKLADMTAGTDTVVGGTFYIYTLTGGTLATASAVESATVDTNHAGFFLVPTDTTRIKDGANNYIYKDGTKWSLEFLDDFYKDQQLYVAYIFKTTSTYKPRFVWNFHNRLFMGNTVESGTYYPWRLRWTEVADMTTVISSNYQDLIDNDVTPIVGGDYQAMYLSIFKTGSIVKGQWNGTAFQFDTAWKDGTYAGRTIQTFQHRQYYLGLDDVYSWDGATKMSITMDQENISTRIRDKIFSVINFDELNNCFGNLYPKYNEYWLWIVKTGETTPSSVFVYNILRNTWQYFEFSATNCVGFFHQEAGNTIASLVGNISEQAWTFAGSALSGTLDSAVLGYTAGDCYIIDDSLGTDGGYYDATGTWVAGTPISSRLITRDFIFADIPKKERVQDVEFEAYGTSVDVSCSGDYEIDPLNFTSLQTITLTPAQKSRHYFPDQVCQHIRFCFKASAYIAIRWIIPYAVVHNLKDE